MSQRLSPFYTDQKTADALIAVAKQHVTQPTDGRVVGADSADATTQFQNTCQFQLITAWKQVKDSTKNFVASGKKIVPHHVGAEKRSYPTTIYAYGEQPTTSKDSVIVATRRANRWVLLPTGTAGTTTSLSRARLVQPKELFPACEYKTVQNVYGCRLEYSDDGETWFQFVGFDIEGGQVLTFTDDAPVPEPHKYWRVDLKGFAKSEDYEDRGFYTFGRLWEALFWIRRFVQTKKTVTRQIDPVTIENIEYTFTANVPENWQVNGREPLAVELALYPIVSNGELFYKPGNGEWKSTGTFTAIDTVWIPAEDLQITVDEKTGREQYNTSFQFRVEQTIDEYDELSDSVVYVKKEVGNLTLNRPTYKLSPERPSTFTVSEVPASVESYNNKLTAKVESLWKNNNTQVSVKLKLDKPIWGRIYYQAELCNKCIAEGMECADACELRKLKDFDENNNGDVNYEGKCSVCYGQEKTCAESCHEVLDLGEIFDEATIVIPVDDQKYPRITYYDFWVNVSGMNIISIRIPRPNYPMTRESAEIALPPPREDIDVVHMPFDSKPVPRKAANQCYWTLTFDQPEMVTKVMLDVGQHFEHYIVAPGGRDANGQILSLIYSFDLAAEKWTATTFPEMRVPMFNMDAKIAPIDDGTHNLIIFSGQTTDASFSGSIQGYNFEKNQIHQVGSTGLSFAGRPALWNPNDWYNRSYYKSDEQTYPGKILILGGGNISTTIWTTSSLTASSVWYSSIFAIDPNDFLFKEVHPARQGNAQTTITGGVNSAFTSSWSVTFAASGAGTIGSIITEELRYTRNQNFPVRGVRRQRPVGNTSFPSSSSLQKVVDFLLIGGFNTSNNAQYNNTVVSGMLGSATDSSSTDNAKHTWSIENIVATLGTNKNGFLYYPPTDYVLGDCCAEYIEERDEVICFGGRTSEFEGALAHETLAVLKFDPNSNNAEWFYGEQTGYPGMPHPRWSAASVLIRGFQRTFENEPCDRIFIIGGRNRDGFVPEVDVFNLRYNEWETDWKGLDQGELETIPASLGGGTIIIGGSDGVQSVKAGAGIQIGGDGKNPVVSAPGLIWGGEF